jgi:hypothetical protein
LWAQTHGTKWRRKIFGPKGDEVTGQPRKQHTEELNDLYPHQIFRGLNKDKLDGWGKWDVGGEDRSLGGLRWLLGE